MEGKVKIMVIEDDPVIAGFLQTGLNYEGYEVTICQEGKRGLDLLRKETFHLLILDLMLPDTDGFEICRRLRDGGSDISILMLTVKKEVSDRVKGLNSGADDYLTKPFDFGELLARIRALLRRSGKISENKNGMSAIFPSKWKRVKYYEGVFLLILRQRNLPCWNFLCNIRIGFLPGKLF